MSPNKISATEPGALLARFERSVPAFYGQADIARGGIAAKDRAGHRLFFPC
jgi:hypothetical protein